MPSTPEVALRKRQQIAKANRMMFVWIAIASVVVGFAAVVSVFLWEKGQFNNEVLSEKGKTAAILRENVDAAKELKEQIRVRNTSQALRDAMAPGETEPIRVVLDALPSEANSPAFASSLQDRFLNLPGLTIESLSVDPVADELGQAEGAIEDAAVGPSADGSVSGEIPFTFSVSAESANVAALQDLLQRLERSIRTIDIRNLKLEKQGDKLVLTVIGKAFYQVAISAELTEKTINPKGAEPAATTEEVVE